VFPADGSMLSIDGFISSDAVTSEFADDTDVTVEGTAPTFLLVSAD